MNVQVDLILPEEQRNASAFNLPALLRILSIVGPAFIILLIILVAINFSKTKTELNSLEIQWETIEIKKEKADNLRNQISENKEILSNMSGIKNSRLEWSSQLINFMAITPDPIQFRRLSVSQVLKLNDKKKTTRIYNIMISGKAIGDKVDITVAGFTRALSSDERFAPYVKHAQVTNYDKDNSPDAGKKDRIFSIECTYQPRIFE